MSIFSHKFIETETNNNLRGRMRQIATLLLVANLIVFSLPVVLGGTVFAGEVISGSDTVINEQISSSDEQSVLMNDAENIVTSSDVFIKPVSSSDEHGNLLGNADDIISDSDSPDLTLTPAEISDILTDLALPTSIQPGGSIDLSHIYSINGEITTFTWYDALDGDSHLGPEYGKPITPTVSSNGVFTFGEEFDGAVLYCMVYNRNLSADAIKVYYTCVGGKGFSEPQVIITTNKKPGETISVTIDNWDRTDYFVDWGDGVIVKQPSLSGEFEIKGSTITVYCNSGIWLVNCHCYESVGFINSNDITSVDVSNCVSLREFYCDNNPITQLDLSKNSELGNFSCMETMLKEIDVSNNRKLGLFICKNNQFTELDLSNNVNLYYFCCSNNKLTKLDVSGSRCEFVFFECIGNDLTEIKHAEKAFPSWSFVDCSDNKLTFSTLPNYIEIVEDWEYEDEHGGSFIYSPQGKVNIPDSISCNKSLDLSSEYSIDGNITAFRWFDAENGSSVTPLRANGGKFIFGDALVGKTLYCTMTNAKYPNLVLSTTKVTIEPAEKVDGEFVVVDDNDYVGDVEPGNAIFEDEGGKPVDLGNVCLIIGNVADNKKITVLEAVEAYNNKFTATDNNHAMYDIQLKTDKGVKVEIVEGKILICLKYPDNLGAENKDYIYNLYHIKDDGTAEEIAIEAKSNGIWFYANDFSPYVLTYELKNTSDGSSGGDGESPKTGDVHYSSNVIIALAAHLGLMIAATIYIAVMRSRRVRQSVITSTFDSADITIESELNDKGIDD